QTWVKCQRLERDASGRLPLSDLRLSRRFSRSDSRSGWRSRVELCPQSPAILVYAAANELRQAYAMPTLSQPEQAIDQLGEQLATSRERAQGWLRRALVESRNRGQSPPPMLYFLIAQAAVAQGDLEQAKRALAQARTAGHIDSWRIDRLAATAAWMAGDLNDALTLAHRARGESRDDGLRLTRYILALIYDRAGAVAQSRNVLKELNARRIGTGEESIEMLLPLHERLYLTALENQAHANVADAMHYWKAYLARPEPADPERQQANLHLQALERPFGL
ncbi:MAG: hypothetical protein ACPG4T_11910, partial [Nannocystaceae bacterium]